jgi:hypothetical protein
MIPGCLALAALTLLLTGCASLTGGTDAANFASVTIPNRSAAEIAAAAIQVFGNAGYQGGQTAPGKLVFEKQASVGTTIAREGIAATQRGTRTRERVYVDLVPAGEGATRLQCNASLITGGDDPFFQEKHPVGKSQSGQYQKLLDQVQQQLK